MTDHFSPCVLIPVYNHQTPLPKIVARLLEYQLPCILVDDGSEPDCAEVIRDLSEQYEGVESIRLQTNRGKGGAVKAGLQWADAQGFSHALQIDADGQHDLADVQKFLQAAQAHPDAVILGQPIFDDSIPKLRFYARYLTHIWVYINTLSLQIRDAMCGYRVYPVKDCMTLIGKTPLEERMAFDVEILVRLYWQGLDMLSIPTRVGYPQDGISHFRGLEDNLRISLIHARLFFGMLWRLPSLLIRHCK